MQEAPSPSDPIPPRPNDEQSGAPPVAPAPDSPTPQVPPIALPAEHPAVRPTAEVVGEKTAEHTTSTVRTTDQTVPPVEPRVEATAAPMPPPVPPVAPGSVPPIQVAAGQPAAPAARVTEVEASPATASDVRGPVIDVAAQRPTPPPEPRAPPAQAVPPPPITPTSTGAATGQPAAPPPTPPPSASAPHPVQPSPLRRCFWAVASHLMLVLVIPTLFLGASITFLIWQLAGRKNPLVEDQGREALNFQINVAGATALLGISCVSAPIIPIVWFVALVMSVIAAIHAGRGERYRYPWCLRIVSH